MAPQEAIFPGIILIKKDMVSPVKINNLWK